jgi:hypothetical protein
MPAATSLTSAHIAARRIVRRHRRPLAAALAATAALLALTSLRAPATPPAPSTVQGDDARQRSGEVTVPVTLASGAIASVLDVGDVVDLVTIPESGVPSVVAPGARVVQLASAGSALSSTASAVVLVAVPDARALDLSAAAAASPLSVIIR